MSAPGRTQVRFVKDADALQIHISGPTVQRIDVKTLEGCVNALVACADRNACLSDGFKLTEKCAETLVVHNREAACVERSFGFAGGRKA